MKYVNENSTQNFLGFLLLIFTYKGGSKSNAQYGLKFFYFTLTQKFIYNCSI